MSTKVDPIFGNVLDQAFERTLMSAVNVTLKECRRGAAGRMQPYALIVEDNTILSKVAELNLRRLGFVTHVAYNGAEAVAMAREGDYSLILMDVHMPIMDGLEATRQIRENQHAHNRRRCPIVAVTASETPRPCFEAGMDDFIRKPADYNRIVRKWIPEMAC